MRDYELTVLFGGNLDEKSISKSVKDLGELLAKTGAKFKASDPAKKDMAYEINGMRQAYYVFYDLELDPAHANELDSKLKLAENVIRFLLVKKI